MAAATVSGVVASRRARRSRCATIVVPDPGPGEARVTVQACGVCHTDLHYREGAINDDFPFLLGHEAAGIVESVGPDVARRRARRLRDPQLARGVRHLPGLPPRPPLVLLRHLQRHPEDDARPTARRSAPRSASARSPSRRSSPRARPPRSNPRPRPEAAGLLGCGVMAGLGAAMYTGDVGRGDSVAVFGCGGVGNAAIAGARLAGANPIIARRHRRRGSSRGPRSSAPRTPSTRATPTRSRRSARSPTATAPTSASRRSAGPRCSSRRSTRATSPAPSCRSACPTRR